VANRAFRSLAVAGGVTAVAGLAALTAPAGGARLIHDRDAPSLALGVRALGAARDLAPGDRIERILELHYGRRGRLRRVILIAKARRSSQLDADRLQGLLAAVDRCSVRWTRKRGGGYRCSRKRWTVLAPVPVIGRRRLRRLSLEPGRTDHLRLTLAFPARAGNGLQGKTSKLVYRLVGF
jgi:hypothetical protein